MKVYWVDREYEADSPKKLVRKLAKSIGYQEPSDFMMVMKVRASKFKKENISFNNEKEFLDELERIGSIEVIE